MKYMLLFISLQAFATPTDDAIDAAIKAAYEQSGVKADVENYGKRLEHSYIAKDKEEILGVVTYLADTLYHSEIKVRITF